MVATGGQTGTSVIFLIHRVVGFKIITSCPLASLQMAIILRGHSKADVTFRFLIVWVIIVICWGSYSLLYDILIPSETSIQRRDI